MPKDEDLPWAGERFRMVPERPADSMLIEFLGPFENEAGRALDCGVIRRNGYRVRVCWPRGGGEN